MPPVARHGGLWASRSAVGWVGLGGMPRALCGRFSADSGRTPTMGEIQGERERATPAENRSKIRSGALGGSLAGECKPECTQVGECKFTTGLTK